MTNITVPSGSAWTIGLSVIRPCSFAVGSPSFHATQAWASSCSVEAREHDRHHEGEGLEAHAIDGTDQLARRVELRCPAVELAVELATEELVEDRSDPRRLAEAELREVAARDLEAHPAELVEVALERLPCGSPRHRERQQRAVGVVRPDERADLRRVGRAASRSRSSGATVTASATRSASRRRSLRRSNHA